MGILGLILLILKIIGIILLAILGVIVAMLLVVLLVPVCYGFKWDYNKELGYSGRVVWLFGLIGVEFSQAEGLDIIAPKPLKSLLSDSDEVESDLEESFSDTEEEFEEFTDYGVDDSESVREDSTALEVEKSENEPVKVEYKAEAVADIDCTDTARQKSELDYRTEEDSDKVDITEPYATDRAVYTTGEEYAPSLWDSCCSKADNAARAVRSKVLYLRKHIDEFKRFDRRYNVKLLVKRSLLLIKKLFSALGLQLFHFYGIIGMDNPADTGFVIAAVSALKPVLPSDVNVEGDFDTEKVELEGEAKGRVFIVRIVAALIWFILDKQVLGAVKYFLRGDEGERVKQ